MMKFVISLKCFFLLESALNVAVESIVEILCFQLSKVGSPDRMKELEKALRSDEIRWVVRNFCRIFRELFILESFISAKGVLILVMY